jgi:hypothetical protein
MKTGDSTPRYGRYAQKQEQIWQAANSIISKLAAIK